MKRSPIRHTRRKPKAGDDPAYLDWLRTQPCVICGQTYVPNEAAHVGPRGLGQKCPDRKTIPLCPLHHRTGKEAHHVLGRAFWRFHGLNRDTVIAHLLVRYVAETGSAAA